MLRELKCVHIKPRLSPFRARLSSTAANNILTTGYGDFTWSRASAGVATLTARHPYSRNGFFFGTPDNSQSDGAYVSYGATSGTGSAFVVNTFDTSGVAADLRIDGVTFGFDSSDLSICKPQSVANTLAYSRVNFGRITGSTGAVAIGSKDFSCTRSSTGVYAITFRRAYAQMPIVLITPISTSTGAAAVIGTSFASRTAAGVTINLSNTSGVLTDFDFYIGVFGQDTKTDGGRGRFPTTCSQRLPRIVACEITNTAGTPTLTIGRATGGADFTGLTDNGTGDFSVTMTTPFKREPAVFAMTTTQRVQVHSYTAGAIRVLTKNAAGTNTDVTGVTHIMAIGSDDASEY